MQFSYTIKYQEWAKYIDVKIQNTNTKYFRDPEQNTFFKIHLFRLLQNTRYKIQC